MTYYYLHCLCFQIATADGQSGPWHVHPRCPVHGKEQYRGINPGPGSYYGACELDHTGGYEVLPAPVPCKVAVDW